MSGTGHRQRSATRRRSATCQRSATRQRLSVLVAAWNEAAIIDKHIASFLRLAHPDRQLVLCAGGEDGTLERAQAWIDERLVVIEQRRGEGKQRALARCLAAADGDVIVLTDADCVFDDDALARLVEPILAGRAEVTTGLAEPLADDRQRPFVRFQWLSMLAALPRPTDRPWGVLGRNCALRRDVVEHLRPFEAPAPTGTDYVLSQLLRRAGYRIWMVPDSRIATRYPRTPAEYLRMWRRWVKNVLVHAPRYGARRELAGVVAAVGLAWFTLLVPLAYPVLGRAALIGPAISLGVASAKRVRRLSVGARRAGGGTGWRLVAGAPLMALLDQAAVLLAVYDAISPRRRTRWH